MLINKCCKVSIVRFASYTNKKTQRFYSKYTCPGSEGVNSFSVDWSNENYLLVSPVSIISRRSNILCQQNIQQRQYCCVHTSLLQRFGQCYLKRKFH